MLSCPPLMCGDGRALEAMVVVEARVAVNVLTMTSTIILLSVLHPLYDTFAITLMLC